MYYKLLQTWRKDSIWAQICQPPKRWLNTINTWLSKLFKIIQNCWKKINIEKWIRKRRLPASRPPHLQMCSKELEMRIVLISAPLPYRHSNGEIPSICLHLHVKSFTHLTTRSLNVSDRKIVLSGLQYTETKVLLNDIADISCVLTAVFFALFLLIGFFKWFLSDFQVIFTW